MTITTSAPSVVQPIEPASGTAPADAGAPMPLEPSWLELYDQWMRPHKDVLPDGRNARALMNLAAAIPQIDAPKECSSEEMLDFVNQIVAKLDEAHVKVAREGLEMSKKKLDDQHVEAMKKIETWIRQCKRAERSGSSALGWVKRIAMPVAMVLSAAAAAAATAATGGAAAPLLGMTLMMSAYSIAKLSSEEAGGPSLGLAENMTKGLQAAGLDGATASLVTGIVGSMPPSAAAFYAADPSFAGELVGGAAELLGADEREVAIAKTTATAVATIAVMVGLLMMGGGQAGGKGSGLIKLAGALGKLSAVSNTVDAGADIAQGKEKLDQAELQLAVQRTQAQREEIDALMQRLQAIFQQDIERLKEAAQAIDESHAAVVDMLKSNARSNEQIAANMARSA